MSRLASVLTLAVASSCPAFAGEVVFFPPARISEAAEGGFRGHAVATDGAQTWVLVSEVNQQILISRSTDGAASWSAPVQLRSDATGEEPTLAFDGTTWLAVWDSVADGIVASRSLDAGVTWSAPEPLDPAAASGANPVVATGNGVWCVVWVRVVGDRDLMFVRSVDGGMSWSTPALLNTDGATDASNEWDVRPALASDGAGTWIAAWVFSRVSGDEHMEIRVARSVDDATTWSSPASLDTNQLTAGTEVQFPSVATDGAAWIVAWNSVDKEGGPPALLGDDFDLLSVRSTDAGATWSAPAVLNSDAATDKGYDFAVRIATDGADTWLAVWSSDNTLGNTLGTDGDVLVAWSSDAQTWSAPEPLDRDAAGDRNVDEARYDEYPVVVARGTGAWVTVWRQFVSAFPGASVGDVLVARGPTPACTSVPLPSCVPASKASLRVNETVIGKESLKASMGRFGTPLSLIDLGDPIGGDSVYQLCFYDQNGALAGAMVVPRAGGICGNNFKPCWQLAGGSALSYGDKNGWSGGVRRLKVQTGSESEAKVVVKGKNKTRQFPVGLAAALAGNTLATMQLAIDDGVCLEATLGSVSFADGTTFAATLP